MPYEPKKSSKREDIIKKMAEKAREIDRQDAYKQKAIQNFQKKPRAVRRFERMTGTGYSKNDENQDQQ